MDLKLLVVVVILHQAWVMDLVSAHCDSFSGPVGKAECIPPVEGYTGSQWATCLSNSYIQEKSKGRHICEDIAGLGIKPDYCYYQCQLEVYDGESGPIYGKCKCDSTNAISNLIPNSYDYGNLGDTDQLRNEYEKLMHDLDLETTTKKDEIADWCTSPDGTECTWYSECLNRRYPCTAAETGHTLDFAQAFCSLYLHVFTRDHFSTQGLKWVNAVRKCLMVSLVPLIRPWMSPTCGDIKQEALESHQHCYRSAFPGAPSVCDIGCHDWAKFFWTVKSKSTYLHTFSFTETMKTSIEAMSTCGQNASIIGSGCPSEILRLTLNYETSNYHATYTVNERDQLAGEITDQLAKRLKWDSEAVGWFAFAPNVTTEDPDKITIDVILGDLFATGLYVYQDLDLGDITTDFVNALEGGQLYDLSLDRGKVSVSTLEACEDMQCTQTSMNAAAGPRPTTAPSKRNFAATIHAQAIGILMSAVLALTTFLV